MGKLVSMRDDLPRAVLHGVADADIGIVGYGANTRADRRSGRPARARPGS